MYKCRHLVVLLALGLTACGGGPRPIYEPPPMPPDHTAREVPRPAYEKPSPPGHGAAPGVVPAASIPQNLAGPLTVARIEPYMDALEMDLRRHVHARGIVTARQGNNINIDIANSLLFTDDGGVRGDDILEPLGAILRGYAHTAITVNGYTDTFGTPDRNMALSQAHARAIAAALAHEGVAAGRIAAQGFGESHLAVRTGDGKKEPRNRRVEILIRPAPG
jgi:outer membrane protein OmpA-like peptidoglycan-associated protein